MTRHLDDDKEPRIFHDESEPAMQTDSWINLLRAENLAGDYSPVCSDYPVRLLTKRTLGYYTADILATRGHSPARLGYSTSPFSTSRPPC